VRVTLIHNPGAGKHGKKDLERLLEILRSERHHVRYQSSKDDDWEKALAEPADIVAVAGGDGTVSRVAKRMLDRGIPLAPLPSGTANNISRTLGLVGRPLEELIRAWPEARRVKLDIGIAEGPWGSRYFIEGVGVGLFASLLSRPDGAAEKIKAIKQPEDRVAEALQRLKDHAQTCQPLELQMALDGKRLSGRYLLAEAVNIPYIGPNLFLAPDAQPGDGSFDVVLVTEAERERLKSYLAAWQENRERLAVLPSHQGKHLRMEWTGFGVHIDDELWPEEDGEAPRAPGAIDLRIVAQVEFLAPDSKRK
jgi:diacylglycerol kinase family enzyme